MIMKLRAAVKVCAFTAAVDVWIYSQHFTGSNRHTEKKGPCGALALLATEALLNAKKSLSFFLMLSLTQNVSLQHIRRCLWSLMSSNQV